MENNGCICCDSIIPEGTKVCSACIDNIIFSANVVGKRAKQTNTRLSFGTNDESNNFEIVYYRARPLNKF